MILKLSKEENEAIQTVIDLNEKILKICTDLNIDDVALIDEKQQYIICHLDDDGIDKINNYLRRLHDSYIRYDFLEKKESIN